VLLPTPLRRAGVLRCSDCVISPLRRASAVQTLRVIERERWARGGDLRAALGRLGLGVFLLGGLYMTYGTLDNYDWQPGRDADAYWRTGQEAGHLWYRVIDGPSRYLYSPAFAQVIAPITNLPWQVFIAIWIAAETAAFAWLLRPLGWRWAVPLLFWLAPELVIGNVLGFIGVAIVLGMRYPGAWALPCLTKPPFAVGLLWFLARREYRTVAVALGTTAAIVTVSLLWQPSLWLDWWRFLQAMSSGTSGVDSHLLYVRFAVAGLVTIYAAKTDRAWLLPVALLIATPVFAGGPSFAILAAIPRLRATGGNATSPQAQTHTASNQVS
jgi:hypothetical protein